MYENLKKFNKIIITGPPRSGTTIAGVIVAKEIGIPFIDETFYGSRIDAFFNWLHSIQEQVIIHSIYAIRDLHLLADYLSVNNMAVIVVKRNTKDILESIKNSTKFDEKYGINDDVYKFFNSKKETLPDDIYTNFEENSHKINNLSYVNYEDFENHELFIDKDTRRKEFQHLKQVALDPEYLSRIARSVVWSN
jgi:hypothetical protein